MRSVLIWCAVLGVVAVPLWFVAQSPLLAWRDTVYIGAGFAGVVALGVMLLQPLLATGWLPGVGSMLGRRVHLWSGVLLVTAIIVHVGGLWLTSPPDVIDALLFVSPTPFSNWGVLAMWAIFAAAGLVAARRRFRLGVTTWRVGHTILVSVAVGGSILHAMLVDGTMEFFSKLVLCAAVFAATAFAVTKLKAWKLLLRRKV